jgi:GDP-D-mannose dehydratase
LSKRALITGVTGQDGSCLAEPLLEKGYEVHGLRRRSSTLGTERIEHLMFGDPPSVQLHDGDLAGGNGLVRQIRQIRPHKVYNLAARSHVRVSFDQPAYTADTTAVGAVRLLEAMWLMLQQDEADDHVIAMNELHSVRDFCEQTFGRLELYYRDFVEIAPRYYRPAAVDLLLGDSAKARPKFGWTPRTSFAELFDMIVEGDLELARQEAVLRGPPASGKKAA